MLHLSFHDSWFIVSFTGTGDPPQLSPKDLQKNVVDRARLHLIHLLNGIPKRHHGPSAIVHRSVNPTCRSEPMLLYNYGYQLHNVNSEICIGEHTLEFSGICDAVLTHGDYNWGLRKLATDKRWRSAKSRTKARRCFVSGLIESCATSSLSLKSEKRT